MIEILEGHRSRRREDRITAAALRLDNNEPADPVLLRQAAWLAHHVADHVRAERLARAAHGVDPTAVSARLWAEALHELGRNEESLAVLDTAPPNSPSTRMMRLSPSFTAGKNFCTTHCSRKVTVKRSNSDPKLRSSFASRNTASPYSVQRPLAS